MKQVAEKVSLPNQIRPGPNAGFLGWLLVAIQTVLAEFGRRINLTVPKDGSELIQMTSYDSVDVLTTSDKHNLDVGYYSFVRYNLAGGSLSLTGVADGVGPEGSGGRILTILNVTTADRTLTVTHEDVNSLEPNRFRLPRGFDVAISPDMAMSFWYDLTSLRWRVA